MSDEMEFYNYRALFVKKLEEALLMIDDIRGLDYRAINDNDIELIRVDWHGEGDPHDYIVVTGDSLREILREVVSLIQEGWAIGQVRSPVWGDELWEEAD